MDVRTNSPTGDPSPTGISPDVENTTAVEPLLIGVDSDGAVLTSEGNVPSRGAAPNSARELAELEAAALQAQAEAATAHALALQARAQAAASRLALARAGSTATSTTDNDQVDRADQSVPAADLLPSVDTSEATSTQPSDPVGRQSRSDQANRTRDGYPQSGPGRLLLGALVEDGQGIADAQVAIPMQSLNRHGVIAGATGTGKTRTLQAMAEQLSDAGVPVFVTDIKGDLSGMAQPGVDDRHITTRATSVGQVWHPLSYPLEFLALGGIGEGVPVRSTITDFGPLLLSRVLDLNATQESSLALIFHWADQHGFALLDLKDLQATINYLTSEAGREELRTLGGVSQATAGVILRKLAALASQGGDVFFGEPAFSSDELLRTDVDGRGVITALQLSELTDRPALFSTFLMWLLASLFSDLPEVGDPEKPRLVFFFDEAHLLFKGASKEFLAQVVHTVRLIRSKGVGVFFVTQTPLDIPRDVVAQLGTRVQHALRAHTPADARALRDTVTTYPYSGYNLAEVLTSLPTGEAIVTVLSERAAPTPVAWTRLVAPQSRIGPADEEVVTATITGSELEPRYREPIDSESAYELLGAQVLASEAKLDSSRARERAETQITELERKADARDQELADLQDRLRKEAAERNSQPPTGARTPDVADAIEDFLKLAGRSLGREINRTLFGTRRRR